MNIATAKAAQTATVTSPTARPDESVARNLFFGEIVEENLFPYPKMRERDRELLAPMVEAIGDFLTPKQEDFRRFDVAAEQPAEYVQALRDMGLFSLIVPEAYGGLELSNAAYARVLSESSKHDSSTSLTIGAHSSIGMKGLLLFGTEAQKARYLPRLATGELIAAFCLTESGAGSDAASIRTKATRNADGSWTLDGEKIWITNGGIAGFYTVFARTDSAAGKMSAFLVEAGGRQVGQRHEHARRDVEVIERGVGFAADQRGDREARPSEFERVADPCAQRLGAGTRDPRRAGCRDGVGDALDAGLGIDQAEAAAQRISRPQRANLGELELPAGARHRTEAQHLAGTQSRRLGPLPCGLADRLVGAQHRIAAEQAVGLERQRAFGAIGDESDGRDRGDGEHQRREQHTQLARGEVAPQQAPGEWQGGRGAIHRGATHDTIRPPASRIWR